MNSIPTWSLSNTRYHLTTYAEGLTVADMDRICNYYCCSTSDTEYLVCHKNSFNLVPPSTLESYTIPAYSYCHRISVNKEQKKISCSCDMRISNGRPCVHILKVLNNRIHGSMFHPRYLKIINHQLYDTSVDVQDLYHQIVLEYKKDPKAVSLGAVWDDLSLCNTNLNGLSEGTALDEKIRMINLRQWNEEGKPFDKHSITTLPFAAVNTFEEPNPDIGMYVDFEMSVNENLVEENNASRHVVGVDASQNVEIPEHRSWFNKMSAELTDISKLCESRPASMIVVLQQLRDIKNTLTKLVHLELVEAGIVNDESEATIVSSNLPMELNPQKKRYKASYESK